MSVIYKRSANCITENRKYPRCATWEPSMSAETLRYHIYN